MLNKIRNDVAHNKVVRGLLVIITIAFVFWGMGISTMSLGKNYAIKVGSLEVNPSDYYRAYQQAKQQIVAQFQGQEVSPELLKLFGIEQQINNNFINQKLLESYADSENIYIDPKSIFELIKQENAFKNEKGEFDKEIYVAVLKNAQLTPVEFEADIAQKVKANLIANLFANTASVSDAELAMQIKYNQERRDIEVLTLTNTDLAALPTPTDEELNTIYQNDIESFKIPEKRSFSLLVVSKDALAKDLDVSDEEVKQYYEDNQAEFFTKPEFKVQQILVKDKATADKILAIKDLNTNFNKYVKEYSTDESSKAKNGDMGWLTADIFGADFENAMNSTAKNSVAKNSIKTVFGYHIFKIEDIKEAKTKAFEQVKAKIKAEILSSKADELLDEKTNQTLDMVSAGEKLNNIAKQLGFTLQNFTDIKKETKLDYIDDVFSTGLNEVSQQIDLSLSSIGFVQVTDIKNESVQPLEQVKDIIVAEFNEAKSKEMLQTLANDVLTSIETEGLSFKDAAKKFKLSSPIQSIVGIARTNNQKKQISDEVATAVFENDLNSLINRTINVKDNLLIVKNLGSFQEPITDENKEKVRQSLAMQKTNDLFIAFNEELKLKNKVKVNQKVIDFVIKQN
jgi:peptidyl-prolyl cis-trans isomerase D